MVLSPNCAKIKSVASKQNSPKGNAVEKLSRISRYHEFKNSPKEDLKKIARRPKYSKKSKGPRDPGYLNCQEVQVAKKSSKRSKLPRDRNCQEVQIAKMSRVQGLPQEIQMSKRSMLSKLPRDPNVQELPREVHIVRSWAFPRNCISLYCKRPTIGADEPSVVKANIVQACNQKRVRPTLLSISWKFQLLANLVH